jgi:uncharacterized protein (DUF2336 family)
MSDRNETESSANQACALLQELTRTLQAGGAEERMRILRRVTDTFMLGARTYSDEQIVLFDDVFQELTAELEKSVRVHLSQKMAGLERAPRRLVRSLAFDPEIEVAAPVLIRSRELTEEDLIENARRMSQAHLLAIAQRMELSEPVTDVLIERGEARVLQRLARNRRARFSLPGCEHLVTRARRDRTLTIVLARREDLPRQYYVKLLENASAAVRAKLKKRHPELAGEVEASVDELATRLQQEARNASKQYAQAVRNLQSRLRQRPVSDADVHAPARAGDFAKTAVALSQLGDFSIDFAERALLDSSADLLLIAAKAAGCSWTTARELLQLPDAGRKLSDGDIETCSEHYRKLRPEMARALVRVHEQRADSPEAPTGSGARVVQDSCVLQLAS